MIQRNIKPPISNKQFSVRVYAFFGITAALACVVTVKLASVQLVSKSRYENIWRNQTEKRVITPSTRGKILDRNQECLAYNIDNEISSDINTKDSIQSPRILESEKITLRKTRRVYPNGEIAGQIIGFTGRDGFGLAGIEYSLDDFLRGSPGWEVVGRDGKRRKYPLQGAPKADPINGCNVILTIDAKLQAIVEKALVSGAQKTGAKKGMAIVLNPTTGEVLAMASYPNFNPNAQIQKNVNEYNNLCLSLTFEPGSIFKIVTLSGTIDLNKKKESDILDGNNGVFEIFGQEIHDEKPFGFLTLKEAVAYSSNVCFAKIACDLGSDNLYKYARSFGFGMCTGINLPGEETGSLHPIKNWSGRTLVTMAIGHEVSGTLLQAACAFGAVANGGVLMRPYIVSEIISQQGESIKKYSPEIIRQVISKESANRVANILTDVVEYGTGVSAQIRGLSIAGKTGTAEKVDEVTGEYTKNKNMASFIGFINVKESNLLCAVTLDEPLTLHTGGSVAAPIFREILTTALYAPSLNYTDNIATASLNTDVEPQFVKVPNFTNLEIKEAKYLASVEGITLNIEGNGKKVLNQLPQKDTVLPNSKSITLITDVIAVPSLIGKSVKEAVSELIYIGVKPKISGAGNVLTQSIVPGTKVTANMECTLVCKREG